MKTPSRFALSVNFVVLLAMVVVLAAIALVARTVTPPTVAEFAPEAVTQIADALAEQSSQFGSGDGRCTGDLECAGDSSDSLARPPRPTPAVVDVARVRRCVGNPPRQTEDPQSPPCVAYWKGDNGGATSKGVTRDEIRIVAAQAGGAQGGRVESLLVEYFNKRFEFYGRQIRIVDVEATGSIYDPKTMQSMAVSADEEHKPFGALSGPNSSVSYVYFDELARRKIVGVNALPSDATEAANYRPKHPYQWHYLQAADEFQTNLADWYCSQLAGRNATRAGPTFVNSPRKFGVMLQRNASMSPSTDALAAGLAKCDVGIAKSVEFEATSDYVAMRSVISGLQTDGITTVACFCDGSTFYNATNAGVTTAASNSGYQPEWLLTGSRGQNWDTLARATPADQRAHVFGLTSYSRLNPVSDSPWFWAVNEMDPSFIPEDGQTNNGNVWYAEQYWSLLALASGIQAAGPNLTPETFAAALRNLKFSNPGAGSAPYFQSTVGFGAKHTMTADFGMIWFSDTNPSMMDGRPGAFCYVGRGARYSAGRWPPLSALFQPSTSCR